MIWTKLTDLPSNKHGLALQYVCKSDVTVHEIIANINSCEIESNEGFQTVLKTLDEIFNYSESNQGRTHGGRGGAVAPPPMLFGSPIMSNILPPPQC